MSYIYGVDIASFQGLPDWKEVKKAGYGFAYVKTTQYPGYLNPFSEAQRRLAFREGLAVGNYCYGVARLGNPTAQADWFLSRSDIHNWHLAPFLDLEESGSEGVSPSALEAFAYQWAHTVTHFLGIKKVILYCDLNMLRNRIRVTRRLRDIFLLDLADWTLGPPPKLPGWDLAFQQYDVFHGVPGFRGPVDRMRTVLPLRTLTIEALKVGVPPKAPRIQRVSAVGRSLSRLGMR